MLSHLSIANLAIIDRLEVSFGPGLNVISGETGAGKSILLGAVNLLLGARAQTDLIRQGAAEAWVEGLFEVPEQSELAPLLAGLGVEPGGEVILSRTISSAGRNRASLNGRLVNLTVLSEIGSRLLSISGQHEAQRLLREEEHLFLLDRFAGLESSREALGKCQAEVSALAGELKKLRSLAEDRLRRLDFLSFQVDEIDRAGLKPNEVEELEAEQSRLRNAEKLSRGAQEAHHLLYGAERSAASLLGAARNALKTLAQMDPKLIPLAERVEEMGYLAEDVGREIQTYGRNLVFDPARQAEVEERLALIRRLVRKYGQGRGVEEVLAQARAAAEEMASLQNLEVRCGDLENKLAQAESALAQAAAELTGERRRAGERLANAVLAELKDLGLAGAGFQVGLTPREDGIGPDGGDSVAFLLSANPGEGLKPLSKVASGGELSRIILGLKSILAGQAAVETVVFDEVDAGLSGAMAERVGRKLKDLAKRHQVLCITHLPQLAAFGQGHYRVIKETDGVRTTSRIEPLSGEARVLELARMLGGAALTGTTLAHAQEMLAAAGNG